jgi:hypothetical protein
MRALVMGSLAVACAVGPLGAVEALAQTFSSGSTGADGAFAPTASVVLAVPADGVFNFTTITIPAGVTVSFAAGPGRPRPPVSLRATGNVVIRGRIDVSGTAGGLGTHGTQLFPNGGAGGPGGFDGGTGSNALLGAAGAGGQGPGGGAPGGPSAVAGHAGHLSPGQGNGGGRAYGDERLVPLVGGSGGGGSAAPLFGLTGGGGGGGGGAIVIAASGTLTLDGHVSARGAAGGGSQFGGPAAGAGSGGAVRLVATTLAGAGSVDVSGGPGAAPGRVRIEAFTNTATLSGGVAGGVTAGMPDAQPLDVVRLRIATVGGAPAPEHPAGSYVTPDVVLPAGAASPVVVVLEASQIPLGTTILVTATPLSGAPVVAMSTPLAGTPATATASASLPLDRTQPSLIAASAAFTLGTAP